MGFRGSLACQGRMESGVSPAFLARGARWVGRASLETLGKEVPLDLMGTLGKLACQVYREILASKETRGVMACQGSQVPGGSQGLWAKLGTKAHLGFLDLLVLRVSQETLAPQGTMALKA